MENYIHICGRNIELTAEQVEELKAGLGMGSVRLSNIPAKDTFKVGNHELVVLEQAGDTAVVVRKNPLDEDSEFGETNNYDGSYVDEICNKWAEEIAAVVGVENMVEFTVDLTSDDGLKDYGEIKRRAALLTTEQYRKYVEILDEHKPDEWWWLATPHSTERHGNKSWVKCVSPSGCINYDLYYYDCGVRPFCILKSNIFVSK